MVLEALSSRARFICTTVVQIGVATAVQPTHRPRSLAAIVFFCPFISAGTNSSREKKITAALDFEKLSILFSI